MQVLNDTNSTLHCTQPFSYFLFGRGGFPDGCGGALFLGLRVRLLLLDATLASSSAGLLDLAGEAAVAAFLRAAR